jgi:hypothetical protein
MDQIDDSGKILNKLGNAGLGLTVLFKIAWDHLLQNMT